MATIYLKVLFYLSIFSKTFCQEKFNQRSHPDTRNHGGYLNIKSRYIEMKLRVLVAIEEKHVQCLAFEYFHQQFHSMANGTNTKCSTDEFEEIFINDLKKLFNTNKSNLDAYTYKSVILSLFECSTIEQNIGSVEFLTKKIATEEMKIINGNDDIFSWIRLSPLHYAIAIQNSKFVKNSVLINLLEKYYDPNKNIRFDPLELAIATRNLAAFEILIKKVSDINKINLYGDSYIDIAASFGHYEFVEIILRKSGFTSFEDVLKADTLDRPLMIAGQEGHISVVKVIWDFLWALDHRFWALFKDSDNTKSLNFDSKVLEFIQNRTELVERYIGMLLIEKVLPILHKRFLPTQIYILYFSEHQKKMNEVQVEEERSYFYTFIDITMIILCYIPLNLKILRPWISHYFSNVISLCVVIMILATSFISNNFVWWIFITCLTLHYNFWICWIGKKKKYTLKIDIVGIGLSITTQLIIFLKFWHLLTRCLTNLLYS